MKSALQGVVVGILLCLALYTVPKVWYYVKVIFTVERILKAQHVPFSYNGLP